MPFHFDYEETFPNTDFNQINLDWILQLATQLKETAESGGFDGAPGEPGTATNGIAYFTSADTFADIQAAITNGELPVLNYYIMGIPTYFYCYDHSNVWVDFIGFYGLTEYQLRWASNGNKSLSSWSLASLQSPAFTGNPTVPTQEPTNSSTRIANTAFVQNAVSVAVQNAIEQFAIAPFTESFKQALLQLARKVAYIDDQGQTYYDALYNALYPPINVDHITAVWNPPVGYVVYDTTPVDSLKTNLTVTATYDDQTTAVLDDNDYVLSGTLTAGTSVITVTYAGATTTFNVTVVANVVESISASFTQGAAIIYDTDSLSGLVPYLTVTATYTNLNTVYVEYPDYTLSGTLTAGTSVITASYSGKTDTFTVTVTSAIWYQLLNRTLANDGPILTGINFMATDVDISIVANVDFAGQSTSRYWRLFTNSSGTSPYPGIYIISNNNQGQNMRLQWMSDGNYAATLAANYVGNIKIVLTHKSGSDKMNYYYKIGNNSLVSGERTAPYVASTVEGRIGGTATEGQFNGTINEFTVYKTVLSDSDISAFFS